MRFRAFFTEKRVVRIIEAYRTNQRGGFAAYAAGKLWRHVSRQQAYRGALCFPLRFAQNRNHRLGRCAEIIFVPEFIPNRESADFPRLADIAVPVRKSAQMSAALQPNFAQEGVNLGKRLIPRDIKKQPIIFVVRALRFQQIAVLLPFRVYVLFQVCGSSF